MKLASPFNALRLAVAAALFTWPAPARAADPLDEPPQSLLPSTDVEEEESNEPGEESRPAESGKEPGSAKKGAPAAQEIQGAAVPHPSTILSHGSDTAPGEPGAPASPAVAPAAPPYRFHLSGFAKLGAGMLFTRPEDPAFVGRSAGFRLQNARIYLDGWLAEPFHFRLSLDGSTERPRSVNSTAGDRIVELDDAFAEWTLPLGGPWLTVRAGQYKTPFNAEDLISTSELKFARRSAVTRGVRADEGYNENGLSYDRQVGAGAGGRIDFLDGKGAVTYDVQVFNGNGANLLANDNRAVAVAARAAGGAFGVTAGVSFAFNPRTRGELPDLLDETDLDIAADVTAEMFGARVFAMFVRRMTSYESLPGKPQAAATGIVAEASYLIPMLPLHFEPAYRFEYYDPSSLFPSHAIQHHTIGLNYYSNTLPLKIQLDYTIKLEDAARALANDELQLLLQVNF